MNNLLNHVTPLTRGIIWLTEDEKNQDSSYYKEIDYLLDGLLTANLKTVENVTSRVIVGKNFDKLFYVLVTNKVVPAEVQSFLSLFEKDLSSENDIILIDENNQAAALKPFVKSIASQFKTL